MYYKHIGISTNVLHNPRNILETVSYLGQHFSVIELEFEHGARNMLDAGAGEIEFTIAQLNRLRKSENIHFSVHAPYIGADCDLAAEDEQVRQVSCQLLRRVINLSARFGVERVTYHPGYIGSLSTDRAIANIERSLELLVPEAAALGISLCMENTGAERPSYQLLSPKQYLTLCQQTGTYLTLDLVHHASLFSYENQLTDEFFLTLEEMLPFVKNVHFADLEIPKHSHLPIGRGNLPVLQLINYLGDRNYQGNAIIEETGGGYTTDEFVTAARDFRDRCRKQLIESKQMNSYAGVVV